MSEGNLNTARMLKTDKRLRAAADWVEPCDVGDDIGCDHGRLGAMLLLENRARHLLASDISEKSLEKARHCLKRHGLTGRAEFYVADGLEAIDQDVDTVCILGMGGETLSGILLRGQDKLHGAMLVLGAVYFPAAMMFMFSLAGTSYWPFVLAAVIGVPLFVCPLWYWLFHRLAKGVSP